MTFQLPLLAANARIFAAETAASGGAGIDVAQAAKLSQESDLDKLERYLLNPDHVTGDRRRSGSNETGVTQYGIKYNQVISIAGANGRVIDVPFAWIRGNDGVGALGDGDPYEQMRERKALRPREYDVIRLLRPLPEHNLPAGSRGTIVVDYTKDSDSTLPSAYEVEFSDADGVTQALVTLSGDDLEVVWRPDPDA
ncbi:MULTISPECIES: DUF4926 domain-containing protein [Mycobacterium avium complex (MAC)]|uniref:Uncharacterized protein n=4 Tax=Mycobacterium avium TaxID=1764 RepID=A0AAI8SS47_MYCAV|nr:MULTISPECIES: DUF4926 domain-containing protein [Mycobacterium avium complex (MAC)]ETZ48299.1 hypothetical protein L839_2409 [Mycobacterium avium MAV_120809_2495]ETZ58485.1 hypothetical protein L841_5284 [Mycobacterium sp. MAC_080597_8934]MDO2360326.1 DUF4926 domain-containing protein [Mycobacterium avium subsp. hominissuis]MDO2372591.1 DUF4926 domain-containing protein [Mycobacterium avium subsp. hominissuis]MDO2386973.1 DUF4926 domain-containing protein [Mycobacterium avium subsp. hominis